MLFNKNIVKLLSDDSNVFKIISKWNEADLTLNILFKNIAWNSTASEVFLDEYSKKLNISLENYIQTLKDIFNGNKNDNNFHFLVTNNEFIISKHLKEDFKQTFALFKLEETDYNTTVEEFMNTAIEIKHHLQQLLEDCNNETKKIKEGYNACTERLNRTVRNQELHEKALMNKFLVLLNAKKDRISQLYEILEDQMSLHVCNCKVSEKVIETKNTNVSEITKQKSAVNIVDPIPSTSKCSVEVIEEPKEVIAEKRKLPPIDDDIADIFEDNSQKILLPKRVQRDEDNKEETIRKNITSGFNSQEFIDNL